MTSAKLPAPRRTGPSRKRATSRIGRAVRYKTLAVDVRESVVLVALARPDVHDAFDDAVIADTAARIAGVRGSPEGKEGVAAFLEKRSPARVPAGLKVHR